MRKSELRSLVARLTADSSDDSTVPGVDNDYVVVENDALHTFKENSGDCLRNAYDARRSIRNFTTSGVLTSSLPEDVFSLINVQIQVLIEVAASSKSAPSTASVSPDTEGTDYFTYGVLAIFDQLRKVQATNKVALLTSFDQCCSSANDFWRMSEKMDDLLQTLDCQNSNTELIKSEGETLISSFVSDAVFAAERLQSFVIKDITFNTSIASDLFSVAWEEDWTQNEVVLRLTHVFSQFLSETRDKLCTDFLYKKALVTSVKAVVCFYVRQIVELAMKTRHKRKRDKIKMRTERRCFCSTFRAMLRMKDDIDMIRDFFKRKSGGCPTILRIIGHELYFLDVVHECLSTCNLSNLENFVVVIHKRTGAEAVITQHFVADLWFIAKHRMEHRVVKNTMKAVHSELEMVTKCMEEQDAVRPAKAEFSSFTHLGEMLKSLYYDDIIQSSLPAACWTLLPTSSESDNLTGVKGQIHSITKFIVEMQLKF